MKLHRLLKIFGFDIGKLVRSFRALPYYLNNYKILKNQHDEAGVQFDFGKFFPCLEDRFSESGLASGHYFHQDLLVARRVYEDNPRLHVDVGSRIDGFVAHVAAYRAVEVIDIRPLSSKIANINFIQADLMMELDRSLQNYCDSLSCLHAMEHFGLGRYGDPINYEGYLFGLNSLYKMLKSGGKLYFSVPIGPQRIEFDAHRVFSIEYLLKLFEGKYQLIKFSYVDDDGELHENIEITSSGKVNNFNCWYGCGIFELVKY